MTPPMEIPALDGVEAWSGGAILPPGWHEIKVRETQETTSSNGHPQAELKMDGSEGSITDWVTITPNSLGRVKQILEIFGIEIPQGKFAFEWSMLVGRQARILIREEPKNDGSGMRSVVKAYEPSSGEHNGAAPGTTAGTSRESDDLPF